MDNVANAGSGIPKDLEIPLPDPAGITARGGKELEFSFRFSKP